jgi:hypothetical protein
MDLREQEIRGSYKWLLCAGTAALVLSCFLFYVDNVIMGGAIDRDKRHAEEMNALRVAQSSLPTGVTDPRQTLTLTIEQEAHDSSAH